jgi:hypothetical protein
MIAVGAIGAFVGLCLLPSGMGQHPDASLLAMGALALALGSVTAAFGIYLKARMPETKVAADPAQQSKTIVRKLRGSCNICHGDVAVITCEVHQLHMCAACLAEHYDSRSCAYVPSTRNQVTRTAKSMAAKARS